jgi:hypothetical protein
MQNMSIGLEQWLGINFSIQYFFAIFCLAYFRFRSVLSTKGKFWNNRFSSAKRRRALILPAQRGKFADIFADFFIRRVSPTSGV